MALVTRIVLSIIFSATIFLAVLNMKNSIPKWIPTFLIFSGLIYFVISIPWILMGPTTKDLILNLSVEDREMLSIYSTMLDMIKNILLVASLFGLSIQIKKQSQRLEPIVKTSADEVEAQGTQAHP